MSWEGVKKMPDEYLSASTFQSETEALDRTPSNRDALKVPFLVREHFVEGVTEKLSPAGAVVTILVSMIGCGVVAMPYAFRLTGTLLGVVALTVIAFLAWLSSHSLINACKISRSATYDQLGEKGLSLLFRRITSLSLAILLIGTVAAYIIIVSNIAESILEMSSIPQAVVFLCVAVLMYPLSVARSYEMMKFVSSFCFCAFLCIVGIMVWKAQWVRTHPSHDVPPADMSFVGVILSMPMLSNSMNGHMNVPQVYAELQRRHKKRASLLMALACVIGSIFYMVAGVIPYLAFGVTTQEDMLKQLALLVHQLNGEHSCGRQ